MSIEIVHKYAFAVVCLTKIQNKTEKLERYYVPYLKRIDFHFPNFKNMNEQKYAFIFSHIDLH